MNMPISTVFSENLYPSGSFPNSIFVTSNKKRGGFAYLWKRPLHCVWPVGSFVRVVPVDSRASNWKLVGSGTLAGALGRRSY